MHDNNETHKDILSNTVLSKKSLLEWIALFKNYLQSVDDQFDPGHRLDHVERVAKSALHLAIEEKARLEVVIPAIWLHDCIPISKFSKERSQSSKISAEFALELLSKNDYPEEFISDIKHAIEAHSYSAGIQPRTLEACIVQDADRLDALGAIGIARTMMLGGAFKNAVYHTEEPFPAVRQPDEQQYVVDHFFVKLFKLKDSLRTDSAKREGDKRTEFMREYVAHLGEEIGTKFKA